MTKFQAKLISDKDTLWNIVKLFHPELPDEVPNNAGMISVKDVRLCAYTNYDWVCIEFRARGYGLISIGVENCNDVNFKHLGMGHKLEDFQRTLDEGGVAFRAWRFAMDCKSDDGNPDVAEYTKILTDAGYELQSAKEWYDYYYKD